MKLTTPSISYTFTGSSPTFPVLSFSSSGTATDIIAVDGYDQIGLLIGVGGVSSAVIRISWCPEYNAANSQTYFECVELSGAQKNGFQRFSLAPKEYGPLPPNFFGCIFIPTAAAGLQLFVYSDSTPSVSDEVIITVMLLEDNSSGK